MIKERREDKQIVAFIIGDYSLGVHVICHLADFFRYHR